jgi:hypothetical protein
MTTTAMTQAAHSSLIRRKPLERGRTLRRTPLALQPALVSECATSARNSRSSRHDFSSIRHGVFFGFAIQLGILNVMRGLYASSTFQPPLIPSDSAAPVWVDDSHEQAREGGSENVDLRHCKSLES